MDTTEIVGIIFAFVIGFIWMMIPSTEEVSEDNSEETNSVES